MLNGTLNPTYNDSEHVKNEFEFIKELPEWVLELIPKRTIKNIHPTGWYQQASFISFYLETSNKKDYYELQVFDASPECPYGALGMLHREVANKAFCFSQKVDGITPYHGYN